MAKKIKLGFSSCPNDTYVFDALIHNKIDTCGLEFDVTVADIDVLNAMALKGELDMVKVSFHAYAYMTDNYAILDAGSALGKNNGPLLVAKQPVDQKDYANLYTAIPGEKTTANLLLSILFSEIKNKTTMLFSDIENRVLDGSVDAGLLIHENRFTYHERGLHKLCDLGEKWDELTGSPIPLGGIVVKRSLPLETQLLVNDLLSSSVAYASKHPDSALDYIKSYAQEMDESVMKAHINLYVNQYTLSLGDLGKKAIVYLYEKGNEFGLLPMIKKSIFVR